MGQTMDFGRLRILIFGNNRLIFHRVDNGAKGYTCFIVYLIERLIKSRLAIGENKMQVIIEPLFCGYTVKPTSKKMQKEIENHLAEYETMVRHEHYIEDYNLENYAYILRLTRRDIRDLEHGWHIVKNKIDPWEYYHGIVGYCSD